MEQIDCIYEKNAGNSEHSRDSGCQWIDAHAGYDVSGSTK